MAIKLLDDHLINKIAAGEVIERPASIVKELVENAIDAGSSKISVSVLEGGIRKIEVTDDGRGIPDGEVELAFARHATSKITREEDLITIQTMGFRGEALPSIASISKLELYTKAEDNHGMRAILEAGQTVEIAPYPTAPGTRVVVSEIFFNTPVRRKFLKSPVSENNYIYDILSKLALSRPDISFSFSNEKKLYFKTPGNGSRLDTVVSIYGKEYASQFHTLQWQGSAISIEGMISRPEFKRVNRTHQLFFVNERSIKSPMLYRAVDEGYRGLLLSREYPAVILDLRMNGNDVDINVHPQKTEVRFRDESTVFKAVHHAIQAALEQESYKMETDSFKALTDSRSVYPGFRAPYENRDHTRYVPQQVYEQSLSFLNTISAAVKKSEELPQPEEIQSHFSEDQLFRMIGQCFDAYILIEKEGSLWLIDQHAAHERIMFNRIYNTSSLENDGQILAFPLAFDIGGARMERLEENLEAFAAIGLQIEILGPDSAVIRSAPARLRGEEINAVHEMLDLLEEGHPEHFLHDAAAVMACKQAIKAGQPLTLKEMETIVTELLNTQDYKNCPHGRPTIMELSREELDKRFKR